MLYYSYIHRLVGDETRDTFNCTYCGVLIESQQTVLEKEMKMENISGELKI